MQVDHREGAVLRIVAEFECRLALFHDALEDHAVHRTVAHALLVLHKIGFGMLGEVDRLWFADAVMSDQRRAPLFRPMSQGLLIRVGAPELDDRAILEYPSAVITDGAARSRGDIGPLV